MNLLKFARAGLKSWWAPLIPALPILLAGLWLGGGSLLTMEYISPGTGKPLVVNMPYHHHEPGTFQMRGIWHLRPLGSSQLRVIPDDHLLGCTVNGKPVDLSVYPPGSLQDWARGFVLDLSSYLRPGPNEIVFDLRNQGGPGGLTAYAEPHNFAMGRHILPGLALLLIALAVARRFSLSTGQIILFLGFSLVLLFYWAQTPYNLRTYDVLEGGGHLDYIRYILQKFALPPPYGGWEYHQPPLYYLMGAAVHGLDNLLGLRSWDLSLQLLSILAYLIMLGSIGATLRLSLSASTLLPATALIFLWPSGFIHAVRLGNDIWLYAFAALSLYYATLWWQQGCQRAFMWAAFWVSLGLLTKTSASAVLGTLGLLWAWRMVRPYPFPRLTWRVSLAAGTMVFLAISGSLGDNVYLSLTGKTENWLFANAGHSIHPALTVGNGWRNWLIFDIPTFISNPFMDGWTDSQGRQYFWNYFLRTSLVSQWFFSHPVQVVIAHIMGVLLLALLGFAIGALITRRRALSPHIPWILGGIMSIASVIAFRHKLPMSPHGDFRFIQYSLGSLALCLGLLLRYPMPRGWRIALTACVCLMPALAVVFVFFL